MALTRSYLMDTAQQTFKIKGPVTLEGEVHISGSKNAALPILLASLLAQEPVVISNLPALKDVQHLISLVRHLGSSVVSPAPNHLVLCNRNLYTTTISEELAAATRASIWVLAPLLARFGEAQVAYPGGCSIGERPIDLHLSVLTQMGAKCQLSSEYICVSRAGPLKGAAVHLRQPSVGATITALLAAVTATGCTTIHNAACEPEVLATADFLKILGARIKQIDSNTMAIEGIPKLHGGEYRIPADRIEAGSFLIAAASSKGRVRCTGITSAEQAPLLNKLQKMGAFLQVEQESIWIDASKQPLQAVDVVTAPYPGFPTDLQPQMTLLNAVSIGYAVVKETVFEKRFGYVKELQRLGAHLLNVGNQCISHGSNQLIGTSITAGDLRGAFTLILAGCLAYGETEVHQAQFVDRGYVDLASKLGQLGAKIEQDYKSKKQSNALPITSSRPHASSLSANLATQLP